MRYQPGKDQSKGSGNKHKRTKRPRLSIYIQHVRRNTFSTLFIKKNSAFTLCLKNGNPFKPNGIPKNRRENSFVPERGRQRQIGEGKPTPTNTSPPTSPDPCSLKLRRGLTKAVQAPVSGGARGVLLTFFGLSLAIRHCPCVCVSVCVCVCLCECQAVQRLRIGEQRHVETSELEKGQLCI